MTNLLILRGSILVKSPIKAWRCGRFPVVEADTMEAAMDIYNEIGVCLPIDDIFEVENVERRPVCQIFLTVEDLHKFVDANGVQKGFFVDTVKIEEHTELGAILTNVGR